MARQWGRASWRKKHWSFNSEAGVHSQAVDIGRHNLNQNVVMGSQLYPGCLDWVRDRTLPCISMSSQGWRRRLEQYSSGSSFSLLAGPQDVSRVQQGVGQGLESPGNQMADPSCCFPEDTGSHRRLLSWRSSRPNGLVSNAYQIRALRWGLKFVREFTRCVSVDWKMRRRDRGRLCAAGSPSSLLWY